MIDRLGHCYRIGHGVGHVSFRLVVARQDTDTLEGDPVWIMTVFDHEEGRQSTVWVRRDTEDTLAYWDEISSVAGSNISRVL